MGLLLVVVALGPPPLSSPVLLPASAAVLDWVAPSLP